MAFQRVDTRDAAAVAAEALAVYRALFPGTGNRLEAGFRTGGDGDGQMGTQGTASLPGVGLRTGEGGGAIERFFAWATDCFQGRMEGYLAVDTQYHDFEHTLQGTLCLARLLHGRAMAGAEPRLTAAQFELAMLAILLHDSGYLKVTGDTAGSGAKYTAVHVQRSGEFAGQLMGRHGFAEAEIRAVQNMIHCTGMNATLDRIPFQAEWERIAGSALASADFLGQMAAPDYVDKLPVLYAEFAEAARFETGDGGQTIDRDGGLGQTALPAEGKRGRGTRGGGRGRLMRFESAEELIRRTPGFWRDYVKPKLDRDFGGLYRSLNRPWPDGPNEYLQAVEGNLGRLNHVA